MSRANQWVTAAFLGCVVAVAGCSEPEENLTLLPGETPQVSRTPEDERLARLQLLRGTVAGNMVLGSCTEANVLAALTGAHAVEVHKLELDTATCSYSADLSADAYYWYVEWIWNSCPSGAFCFPGSVPKLACSTAKLQTAAGPTGLTGSVSIGNDHATFSVRPSGAAERVAILRLALYYAQLVAYWSQQGALSVPTSGDSACGTQTRGEVAITTFIEGYHLHQAIQDDLTEALLAAGEQQRNSTNSLALSASREVAGNDLSRAAAAHVMVDGDLGLHLPHLSWSGTAKLAGGNNQAFCSAPELSSQVKMAVSLLREAAPNPLDVIVLTNPTTENLLAQTSLAAGSVRKRLGNTAKYPQLGSDCATVPGGCVAAGGVAFAAHFGLHLVDFEEARRYLADEIKAFSRPMTAVLNPTSACTAGTAAVTCTGACTAGSCTTIAHRRRYAATAAPPGDLDPVYWAALARFKAAETWSAGDPVPKASSVEAITDGMITDAQVLAGAIQASSVLTSGVDGQKEKLSDLLGVLLQGALRTRTARVVYRRTATNVNIFTLNGLPHGTWVVNGEDGLRCATKGDIEGAPCTFSSHSLQPASYVPATPGDTGFANKITVTVADTTSARWYVVKPRLGVTAPAWATIRTTMKPGDFEPVVGGYYRPDTNQVAVYPVIRYAQERAADALRPHPKWCTRSAVECDGSHFDARLPLENELSDDGDGVEDSWRHALDRAKEAAFEADSVGQEYVGLGLDASLRGETVSIREQDKRERVDRELDELQDICGMAVDTELLLQALGGNSLSSTAAPSPPPATHTLCPAGGTYCYPDLQSLFVNVAQNGSRLHECLGDDTFYDAVTLGSRPLCYTTDVVTNDLCPADTVTAGLQCPQLASINDTCPTTTAAWKKTSAALGFFDSGAVTTPLPSSNDVCIAIRNLRGNPTGDPYDGNRSVVKGSTVLNPGNVQAIARRLGWEGKYGGYATVTLDGQTLYTTGDYWVTGSILQGSVSGWPCASTPDMAQRCGASPPASSFFCNVHDCNSVNNRSNINNRLFRAVLFLKGLAPDTGGVARNLRVPLEFFTGAYTLDVLQGLETEAPFAIVNIDRRIHPSSVAPLLGAPLDVVRYRLGNGQELDLYRSANPDVQASVAWTKRLGSTYHSVASRDFALLNVELPLAIVSDIWPEEERWWGTELDGLHRTPLVSPNVPFVPSLEGVLFSGRELPGWMDLPSVVVPGSSSSNYALVSSSGSNKEAVLDALELACEVRNAGKKTCNPQTVPVATGENLSEVQDYLDCMADQVLAKGASTLLRGFPARAVDALREQSVSGSFPAVGGQIGTRIGELRQHVSALSNVQTSIASEVGGLGDDMEALRITISQTKLQAEAASLRGDIQKLQTQASCVAATMGAIGASVGATFPPTGPGAMFAAEASVVNAALQCQISDEIASTTDQLVDTEAEISELTAAGAVVIFRKAVRQRVQALAGLKTQLSTAVEGIDTTLTEIDRLRKRAQRVISRAIFMDSAQAEKQEEISLAMAARRDGLKQRYDVAFKNAKKLTFVAKRAIEQRLGVHLSELRDELPLVEAPSTWEAGICSASGLDYTKLELGGEAAIQSFAGGFIGDYVTKLENLVESYRMEYGFHEGFDTAVVSLRDDVLRVRGECEQESGNLFRRSADLGPNDAWTLDRCEKSAQGVAYRDCVSATRTDEVPFTSLNPERGAAPAFRVVFGPDGAGGGDCGTAGTCGFRSRLNGAIGVTLTSALAQSVSLTRGRYLLSWYEKATTAGDIAVVRETGVQDSLATATLMQTLGSWRRFGFVVSVTEDEETLMFRILQRSTGTPEVRTLAGFMLEDVSDVPSTVPATVPLPTPFVATAETTTYVSRNCQPQDGAPFQARWERKCERLCSGGLSSDCGATSGTTKCFWELPFSLSQWAIERGDILQASGFAVGNFNYRIESVGVNFVGSGTRDCSDSPTPSACYGAAFIPYSLRHAGPHFVRNHFGTDFKVNLFPGNIEHARGLAGERYLTNPLSASDSTLFEQYLRGEFQGRPLDGSYTLRVWEEDGVDFRAIHDAQVVLKYRYWTRFN